MSPRTRRLLPYLALAGLGLLFFFPLVLHPAQVLYSDYSDILAEHIPAKRFLVRSWQETGELPLWCPYSLGGSPFVHDIQVGMFYPPHWLLLPLSEAWVGVALSWLIVAHVIAAGWCMYAYARSQDLGEAGAFVAAVGYMFAGKWLLHLLGGGHYILIGLAWLPLVLLCLERAIRRGSIFWATGAGVLYGLLALGTQPQWTFYAGLFLALWTLGTALFDCRLQIADCRLTDKSAICNLQSAILRWAGFGLWTAVLGAALAAVQFLPTLEAARHSMRSVGVDSTNELMEGLVALTQFFGPALHGQPEYLANVAWEDRGGFGVLWVAAAALAPVLCRGRVRYQALVVVVLLVFAFGGSVLLQRLPGFNLFRQHARLLLTAALPVAYLAGVATHALLTAPGPTPEALRQGRRVLLRVLVVAAILVVCFAVRLLLQRESVRPHLYWATLLLTVPAAFWLLSGGLAGQPRRWALLWTAVLLLDVWGVAWPMVQVRSEAEVYPPARCVQYLADRRGEGRVLDRSMVEERPDGTLAEDSDTPLGAGAPLAMIEGIESLRGYNPLDTLRYKEYLQFLADEDRPLRPLDPTNHLTFPVINNLKVKNKPLLDLLAVRFLLQPSNVPLEQPGWRMVEEDPSPAAYNFIAGGVRQLSPYTVYENQDVFPRAFVVPDFATLPTRDDVLAKLKDTDFRQTVLLTGVFPIPSTVRGEGSFRAASLAEYRPNRVAVAVADGPAGWLVLTDVWYPGWEATVDGEPAHLLEADYLFRGVQLSAGPHEVVFTFAPTSYYQGRAVSAAAFAVAAGVLVLGGVVAGLRRRGSAARP